MADDKTVGVAGMSESFVTHMQRKVQRSREAFPDDWRTRYTFYDGEVANLLEAVLAQPTERSTQEAAIEGWYDKWLSRERTQQLMAENAAMREIVEKFVSLWVEVDDTRHRTSLFSYDGTVDVEALREQARTLLARNPA